MRQIIYLSLSVLFMGLMSCEEDNLITPEESGVGTLTDIEGNVYNTVKIGDQWWMAENLKTTKYNNGSSISNISSGSDWATSVEGAYCTYQNDDGYRDTFGLLYNYYVIESGNLCPNGWRVPTAADWKTLLNHIDSTLQVPNECDALRSNSGWWNEHISEEANGFDLVGFKALPSGHLALVAEDSVNFHGKKNMDLFLEQYSL